MIIHRSVFVTPLVFILALTHHPLAAEVLTTESTQSNVPIELTLSAQQEHAEPFWQVRVNVVFTEPDGTQRTVPAFWAGENRWKVRYSSSEIGRHPWRSECNIPGDAGLHGITGDVGITPYTGNNPLFEHGPIHIAEGSRYFSHADGTPFFWLGDTWWMGLCHRLSWPDDFQKLTADRKAKGFNVVQIVAGLYPDMPAFDPRGANEAGFPWEKDYASIRPEYFDAADQRLRHLVDEGMTPCIVGAWGYFLPWMSEEKMQAHWRYLIARYGAWPVVWCAAGEANLPWYQADGFPYDDQATARRWCEVMKFIRATDPWRRPLTIHPTAINAYTSRHVVNDPSLLDFDLLQTPHDGPGTDVEAAAARTVVESRAAMPTMPVVNGEASYENLLDRIPAEKPRAMFWLCMMSGAAGHTYGANGIWQVNREGQPHGPSPTVGSPPTGYGTIPWDEAMHLPGGRQIASGKQWLVKQGWSDGGKHFQPHFNWAAWATAPPPAAVPPHGIGHTDGTRIYYMVRSGPIHLLQLQPGQRYRLTHFDPVETTESEGGLITADRNGAARLEPPQHGHDWVVRVVPDATE